MANLRRLARRLAGAAPEQLSCDHDTSRTGERAPHTDYTSRKQAQRLFSAFAATHIDIRNFEDLVLFGKVIPRRLLLGNVARVAGLGLYVVARA